MDISLNITQGPSVKKIPQQSATSSKQKARVKGNKTPGFSFKFTKNDKVKAVVARRRVPKAASVAKVRKNYVSLRESVSPESDSSGGEETSETPTETLKEASDGNITIGIHNSPPKKKAEAVKEQPIEVEDVVFAPRKPARKIDHRSEVYQPQQSRAPEALREESDDEEAPRMRKRRKLLSEMSAELPSVEWREVKSLKESVFSGLPITALNLHPHLVKNLDDLLQIKELTSIQQRAIPTILEQKDVLIRSQTGSGKTLTYALPVVQILQDIRPKLTRDGGIQALVVAPTRELVIQTYELFVKLLKPFTWIIPGYLCGGEKRKSEKARLRKGINIMIGTPGRLCDHLTHTESFQLSAVKWLILDEADRLLELGYERDVGMLVEALNAREKTADGTKTRQTMLLSATLTPAVEKLAGLALNDPLFIDNTESAKAEYKEDFSKVIQEAISGEKLVVPDTIKQIFVVLPPKLRLPTLSGLIALEHRRKKDVKLLVFMATQDIVDFHHDIMVEMLTRKVVEEEDEEVENEESEDTSECLLKGVRFFRLHGSMTQTERKAVFKEFRNCKSGVLLSTDVAARGLDVPEVDCVVQFTPPQKLADYVHRIGRTARAGRSGRAVIFLNPSEVDFVHTLNEKGLKLLRDDFKKYLKPLVMRKNTPNAATEAVSDLQHKCEQLIAEDQQMREMASRAFVSWIRFYSAFPKDLRHIFNRREIHMGHFAKSLGLREPPSKFARNFTAPKAQKPVNRLTFGHKGDDDDADEDVRSGGASLAKFATQSRSLTTSEFDSGMLPGRRKRKA
ncbi:probable ATP-dependent RNA helicase CG8611 isoform X2 [Phlebotomus argentipes]|uniref:probable ATP-dependent RNA helicase CG8611 isoform X2 n=1 Tax=Phlebotomus argentipes TaxID=94469 RepID=UPI0028937F61|nr:probable ATP-dependent RNA helicase CG8611 isoform X2 [Phlebotomus argentipes]